MRDRRERKGQMKGMGNRKAAAAAVTGIFGICLAAAGVRTAGGAGLSASTQDLTAEYRRGDGTMQEEYGMEQEFRESYMEFSLALLKYCRGEGRNGVSGENVLVSPVSVITAVGMAGDGAKGETLSQINQTLYAGLDPDQAKEGVFAFRRQLSGKHEGAAVKLADSVWLRTGDVFVPNEEFLAAAEQKNAAIYGAPFDETTCGDINRWVEKKTDGEISEILDEIPQDAVMYLINAVAFEAEWEEPYTVSQITDAVFYGEDGTEAAVTMMYSEEAVFLSGAGARGVRKPYLGGYSFVALMPEEGTDFSEWLDGFDKEAFLQILGEEKALTVQTGIPKMDSRTDLELSAVLADMGMPLAFDEKKADFSGIGSCTDGANIFISRVLHGTHICVDGKGTKAGAATVVEMTRELGAFEEERVVLDRPFLYAIVEDESGLPVFLGTAEHF